MADCFESDLIGFSATFGLEKKMFLNLYFKLLIIITIECILKSDAEKSLHVK